MNQYSAVPWSLLWYAKPIWHREVPVGGNANSPCVSKWSLAKVEENKIFKSTHTANYKQVIEFGTDPSGDQDHNLMSIDTGMGGTPFGPNYFSMNAGHLRGELHHVSTDFARLVKDKMTHVLYIKPLSKGAGKRDEL